MDVDPAPEYIGVRETARRLGIHENTVRNWARDGVLVSARIPGSRFHRFDVRDVERLRRQRGASVSSLAPERRTVGPELVDANDLSQWAATRDAQSRFPELIRRLLASTAGVTNVSVRAGEGVSAPGWDGQAESAGTSYLPKGHLQLEFGVGTAPKSKADADYEKRRRDPCGVVASDVVFVFATPRRWPGAASWASAREGERVFRQIRVLDADDLEGWLQQTPVVHHWISEHLGRRPRDAETLEQWWRRFRDQTDPSLPSALFLSGRADQRARLEQFFVSAPSVIAVQAGWRNDAIAFICATMDAMRREDSLPAQPPLLVFSPDVWSRVVLQPGRMTLIPLFEDPDLASARDNGHHVVIPLGANEVARGDTIVLPRPGRLAAAEALEAAGVESDRTYRLAALARRSTPSLVRSLARNPSLARPEWSRPPASETLAPLLLVGAWTDSDDDTALVSQSAGRPWAEVERTLTRWQHSDDPPYVKSSNQWQLASPEEAFLVLRDMLAADDLRRWHDVAIEVLLEPDPTQDLSIDERPFAGMLEVGRKYSPALRSGLAQGIALVGSASSDDSNRGACREQHARNLVRELLARARDDSSGRTWRCLADVLPLLAEAAPLEFLDAVLDDLSQPNPTLRDMFQDADQSSWLYSSSPHTGLLWALEGLCWSERFLVEAARALALLHGQDPGGRLANRPLNSLKEVFVWWVRHTSAPLTVRVLAVETICREQPDVGWQLLMSIWPSHHATSSPPHSPRFRDWQPESRGVPISEGMEYLETVVRLAIELAGDDLDRLAELGEGLSPLPPAERARVLRQLDRIADPEVLTAKERLGVWERLHKEVARHQRFASAEWSMDESALEQLSAIADRLEPTESVQRLAYLFDWRPDVPGVDPRDREAFENRLSELRGEAVTEALGDGSIDGVRSLAERAPVPTQLGWTLGAAQAEHLTDELLTWLDDDDQRLRDVASSWASRVFQDRGVPWLREMLQRPELTGRDRQTNLVLSTEPSADLWDALIAVDPSLSDVYWERMSPWRVHREDVERAARELLSRNRAWAAVDVLSLEVHRDRKDETRSLDPAVVESALTAAMQADPQDAQGPSLGYELGQLLDYLEGSGTAPADIAHYEFVFFRLLEDHREPRALFSILSTDPRLFVDLVTRVYRGKDEPKRQLNEHQRAMASHAWWILNHWRTLPGARADGTVDGQVLAQWVTDARLALSEVGREDIGDEQIGQVLAASPTGSDGIWPAEPVREVIEAVGSTSLETGIHVGVVNARGVTSRGPFEGGDQERRLAARYMAWSNRSRGRWPRTARVLRRLADDYERDAEREDRDADLSANAD